MSYEEEMMRELSKSRWGDKPMKNFNGDDPAQPQPLIKAHDGCIYSTQEYDPTAKGFTKREEMAMRFAASMLSNDHALQESYLIGKANKLADAMLKSWENEDD